jgi:hypothetical protein
VFRDLRLMIVFGKGHPASEHDLSPLLESATRWPNNLNISKTAPNGTRFG